MTNENEINHEQTLKDLMLKMFPNFTYLNGVLSGDSLGEVKLWYWFGKIRIHENDNQTKSKDMKVLTEWKINKDGDIKVKGVLE